MKGKSFIIKFYLNKMVKKNRESFLAENNLKIEMKKINEILSILMPKFVKDLLVQGIYSLSANQEHVAILFCDICQFDKIITTESTNITKILDNLFRVFDQFSIEKSVQKIEV